MSETASRIPPEPHTGPLPPASGRVAPPTVPDDGNEPHARSWPALLFVAVMAFGIYVPKRVESLLEYSFFGAVFGGPACLALVGLWWMFFSNVRWPWKWPVVLTLAAGGGLLYAFGHETVVAGFQPMAGVIPAVTAAGVLAFGLTYLRPTPARVVTSCVTIAVTFALFGSMAIDGFNGEFTSMEARWRWEPSPEEAYAAKLDDAGDAGGLVTVSDDSVTISGPDWPRFRGPNGDSAVEGVTLATDWDADPPREIWRRPVGPGWSSFAYVGGRLFTQEQRGEEEAVVCWEAATGAEVWAHTDATRFTETIGGPGPRATPTVAEGRVYSVGANGAVNCLEAATGEAVWSRDLVDDTGTPVPTWGFAGSPAVTDSHVIILAGGPEPESDETKEQKQTPHDKAVIAYDRGTGEIAWTAPAGRQTYSSPAVVTLAGRRQVVVVTSNGLDAYDPGTGEPLWSHLLADGIFGGRTIQPAVVSETDVILPPSDGGTMRRLRVVATDDGYDTEIVWETKKFKPNFNDYVVADGQAYGFDVNIFASFDLETGERNWKKGRYGFGQVLLLRDAGQLLVTSETSGELILLAADPEGHEELAKAEVVEGKTWNHPLLVGRHVFVRNGVEAVCLELPVAETAVASRD